MDDETRQHIRAKCQNAAFRLQAEAYAKQSQGGRIKLKQFLPCAKGLVYSKEAAYPTRVLAQVANEVVTTHCNCHPDFLVRDAIAYECDPSFNPYVHTAVQYNLVAAQDGATSA